MLSAILQWILHSNGAKTAGAAVAGSGITVAALLGIMTEQIDAKVAATHREIITYVDNRHDGASKDLKHIKENQDQIKVLIQRIDDRIYEINRKIKN